MIKLDFKSYLSTILNEHITNVSSVPGGDISKAFRIQTPKNAYFLKTNSTENTLNMFKAEADGLHLINATNTIKTPKVIACKSYKNSAFLLLEFIENKAASQKDFKNLGRQLAELHKCTSENFGLNTDNFIGSLPQCNTQHKTWVTFYASERLFPQLEFAKQKHLLAENECPTEQEIKDRLESYFFDIKPSLLHGDLWSGNYLISTKGDPYLIDPAIYYGHHEVDIAMSKLFGSFGDPFYESYFNDFPPDGGSEARLEIYQLYYLLVHLNLFGNSYYDAVITILKKYFSLSC